MFEMHPEFATVWKEFKQMRKKKKKPLTDGAEQRQMNKVKKLFQALNNVENLITHLHCVVDSHWDNIYSNDEHFNNIVNSFKTNRNETNRTSKAGTNFFTYSKGSAYEQTARDLLETTTGFDFISESKKF